MKKITAVLTAFMLVLALSACGLQLTDLNLPSALNEIVLEKGTSTTINFIDEFATEKYATEDVSVEQIAEFLAKLEIAWTSSDTTVATVDNGTITAVGAGSASITASVEEQSLVVPVKVIVTPTDMKVTESIKLYINGTNTAKIDVGFTPADATETDTVFASNNEAVAFASEDGTVTAVSAGTCEISVNSGALNKVVTVSVAVKATDIGLNRNSATINIGKTVTVKPYLIPTEAETQAFTFTSSNSDVATVNGNGTVRGVSAGTATITVTTAEGLVANFTVTVLAKQTNSNGVSGSGSYEPGGQASGGASATPTAPAPAPTPTDTPQVPYEDWIPVDINNDGGCGGD